MLLAETGACLADSSRSAKAAFTSRWQSSKVPATRKVESLPPNAPSWCACRGDTGAAVASAFHQRPGFRVVILYPDGRVAPRQAHQLGAFGDNVSTFRVDR